MENILLNENERIDDLQIGNMRLIQNKNGFCFGVDAVLLSDFADIKKGERVLDLCTGNGIIPALLAAKYLPSEIWGIEITPYAAHLAKRNMELNRIDANIIEGDLNDESLLPKAYFDHITCNPPYKRKDSGLKNPDSEVAIARHEVKCTLEDVIRRSAALLRFGGKFSMIHRPDRLGDIFYLMRKHSLEPKRLRSVYPREGKDANMVLVEGAKGGGAFMKNLPPLYVYEGESFSREIEKIYGRGE